MALTPDQEERLEEILQHGDSEVLTQWERDFLQQLAERYENDEADVVVSAKMWAVLQRIEGKVNRGD